MQKIILFYKFANLSDPQAVLLWQKALCQKLDLRGRIIISPHGINATLGGDIKDLKSYIKDTKTLPAFKDTSFKWSDGKREDFPKLSAKIRKELVTFGIGNKLKVDDKGVVGGGKHLKPKQIHKLVEEKGDQVVFFDGRNAFEAEVGKFKDAVVPSVEHTRDFSKELKNPKYNSIKDKPVVTYCTGGIRCEVLTVMMKENGFKDVYQMDGGIVKYGEEYKDDGLWEGSLYVFDDRMGTKFSDKAKDIASCVHCHHKTSNYENCSNKSCNKLIVVCDKCKSIKTLCPKCQKSLVTV